MTKELVNKILEIEKHLDIESKEWVFEGLEELIGIEISLHSQDLKRKIEEMVGDESNFISRDDVLELLEK